MASLPPLEASAQLPIQRQRRSTSDWTTSCSRCDGSVLGEALQAATLAVVAAAAVACAVADAACSLTA